MQHTRSTPSSSNELFTAAIIGIAVLREPVPYCRTHSRTDGRNHTVSEPYTVGNTYPRVCRATEMGGHSCITTEKGTSTTSPAEAVLESSCTASISTSLFNNLKLHVHSFNKLTWRIENDGVDAHPLLECGDQDGDSQLRPIAAAQDGAPGIDHGAGYIDSIDNILQLHCHVLHTTDALQHTLSLLQLTCRHTQAVWSWSNLAVATQFASDKL